LDSELFLDGVGQRAQVFTVHRENRAAAIQEDLDVSSLRWLIGCTQLVQNPSQLSTRRPSIVINNDYYCQGERKVRQGTPVTVTCPEPAERAPSALRLFRPSLSRFQEGYRTPYRKRICEASRLFLDLLLPVGLNKKDEVVGPGQAIERSANSETKHEYGLAIGTAKIYAPESNRDSVTSIFRQFQVSLQSCPKQESNLQYVGHMQFAGPNDAGQVAISCDKDAVIYKTSSGRSTPFFTTDKDYLIKVSGISNSGSVLGCAMQPAEKAFVYGSGKFSLLPIPDENSCALGINAKGQIVGFSGDNAFIYWAK
jgi:hypothetical protein